MYQEVWSATFRQLSEIIETSATKHVFLCFRFQRDVHLSSDVFNDVHFNETLRKQFRDFPFIVRNELTHSGPLTG